MHTYYFDAAFNRKIDFEHLNTNNDSAIFSLYCAGVAVECMLRAYITRYTSEFDGKHDLQKLYIQSQLSTLLSEKEKSELLYAIKTIKRHWSNDLRYHSIKKMKLLIGHEFAQSKSKDFTKFIRYYFEEVFTLTNHILKIGREKWN